MSTRRGLTDRDVWHDLVRSSTDSRAMKPRLDLRKRFVGTWKCSDLSSDVSITIRRKGDGLTAVVIDGCDDEKPDVYDLLWNDKKQELSFAALWSSGRFVKYRFISCLAKNRLELTFTFTDQEQWERA